MSRRAQSTRPRSKRPSNTGRRGAQGQRAKQPSTPPASPARSRLWRLLGGLLATALAAVAPVLIWATLDGAGPTGQVVTRFSGGESAAEVAERLRGLGLIQSPRLFAVYLGWFAPRVQVAPGSHVLRGGLSPRDLVQRLGRLASRPAARVTVPEGYTHMQIGERLEEKEICTRAELARAVRDVALLKELEISGTSAEGYLFPATYQFSVDSDPAQIVRLLVTETRKRLARLDARHAGAFTRLLTTRQWREHELLTLASIVEREASAAEEQRLIARVFFNRLDDPTFRPARMLQSDPTAAYGCQLGAGTAPSCAGFAGKVTPEMLRDPQNPYNTYRHPGLPPGPIGNPGEAALEAVLEPATADYLYFVADGRGRHRFSRSFEGHRRAIEQGP